MFRNLIFFGLTWLICLQLPAQTQLDEILMKKSQLCIAGIGTLDTWDRYWEGTLLRPNGNIGDLNRTSYSLMAAYGLSTKLNVLVNVPFHRTEATQGQLRGVSGFQDISAFLKYQLIEKQGNVGKFSLLASGGFSTPMTNYLPDYAPLNLGLGAQELSARAIAHFITKEGWFARTTIGYLHRTFAEIERDYYYTDIDHYSSTVDVPDALHTNIMIGKWLINEVFRTEIGFERLQTLSGHDIRRQDVGFPSNKMESSRIGLGVQYYPPSYTGFGFVAQYWQTFDGRNLGKSQIYMLGVTYQFFTQKTTI